MENQAPYATRLENLMKRVTVLREKLFLDLPDSSKHFGHSSLRVFSSWENWSNWTNWSNWSNWRNYSQEYNS